MNAITIHEPSGGGPATTRTEQDLRASIAADIIAELTRAQAAWRDVPNPDLRVLTGRAWFGAAMHLAAEVARSGQATVCPQPVQPAGTGVAR